MLKIKRLYTFIIQTFVPVFAMTFGICLFIVLMQFLWRYVEDLVGKGLDVTVLGELFLYAALQLIPMALPLSLLLASLMAFGNLGERLELLAIKASGVSLLRTMKPLIILVGFIAIGAFFFQNQAMPHINVKFRSLLFSIKQKSPELEIPEGSFYNGIKNHSMYVKEKDKKTKMLHGVMIYDTSDGFDNMSIIVCDSALLKVSEDKKFLLLSLFSGQRFANLQGAGLNQSQGRRDNKFIRYARENFKQKNVIIPFNSGFDRMDEANMEGSYVSKNIVQLEYSIDSMHIVLDSLNRRDRGIIGKNTYLTYRNEEHYKENKKQKLNPENTTTDGNPKPVEKKVEVGIIDFDSLVNSFSKEEMSQYLMTAASESENNKFNLNTIEYQQKQGMQKNIRYHKIEWHQKFTLSFACLIFFFIGAPLGAIIRKGGLGMPVVVSVCLFIVYYIINNIGYKLARDAVWEVWQGMWLSSAVLFPLGVFLTYKAMNDSTLFNPEAYNRFFRKILCIKSPLKITDAERNVMIQQIPNLSEIDIQPDILYSLEAMDSDKLREVIQNNKQYRRIKEERIAALSILKSRNAEINDIVDRQDKNYIEAMQQLFNTSSLLTIVAYVFFVLFQIINIGDLVWIINISYILLYIRSIIYYYTFYKDIKKQSKIYHLLTTVLLLAFYPITYLSVRKRMENDKKEVEIITHS